jgi:hypothetical protein
MTKNDFATDYSNRLLYSVAYVMLGDKYSEEDGRLEGSIEKITSGIEIPTSMWQPTMKT